LVVLVTTDCWPAGDAGLPPGDPQPLASITTTAVTIAVEAAITPARRPLISTPPTVTFGLLVAGQAAGLGGRWVFTTVCRTHADTRPAER
jgi:hypothetical protein